MKINFSRQSLKWLDKNGISSKSMDTIIHKLCKREGRTRAKRLRIHIMPRAIDSNYDYYTNTLNVAVQSKSSDARYLKIKRMLRNLLHELRHFIQFRIQNKPFALTYTYRDATLNNSRYWNDPDEIDARKYERQKLNSTYRAIKRLV
jgi:hypothetical protein